MKINTVLCLLLLMLVSGFSVVAGRESLNTSDSNHMRWLYERIREAKSIKIGMSRAELLILFSPEGGFGVPRIPERYVLKSYPAIHVKIEFDNTDKNVPIKEGTSPILPINSFASDNALKICAIAALYVDDVTVID